MQNLKYAYKKCKDENMIHVIFVIRRVFVCMELSSKSELIYII